MKNTKFLFWQISRGYGDITIDDCEPTLVADFLAFVQAAKKEDGSVLKCLQKNGYQTVEEKISREAWVKMISSMQFFVIEENAGGDEAYKVTERSWENYDYLFEHLDIYSSGVIYPDDLLAVERLATGESL